MVLNVFSGIHGLSEKTTVMVLSFPHQSSLISQVPAEMDVVPCYNQTPVTYCAVENV